MKLISSAQGRGGVIQTRKPSVGGAWIFSGAAQLFERLRI